MPQRARVDAFVAQIERGEFVEAMPEFYAEDATAQENGQPPRVGLATLIANERKFLERAKFEKIEAQSVVVEGDRSAINWLFEIRFPDGRGIRLDEIAYQEWRGEKIVRERYFYDPAQMTPR